MKYTEDKWAIDKWGLEKCRQMDAYYDNLLERKNNLVRKALSKSNELAQLIREKTGLKDLNFIFSHHTKRNSTEMLIEMESSEIKNPFIALAWKSFKIENFGGGCWARKNKEGEYHTEADFSKPSPEVGYSMDINFSYESISHGSNGTEIGRAYFLESEGHWKFELEKDRK